MVNIQHVIHDAKPWLGALFAVCLVGLVLRLFVQPVYQPLLKLTHGWTDIAELILGAIFFGIVWLGTLIHEHRQAPPPIYRN